MPCRKLASSRHTPYINYGLSRSGLISLPEFRVALLYWKLQAGCLGQTPRLQVKDYLLSGLSAEGVQLLIWPNWSKLLFCKGEMFKTPWSSTLFQYLVFSFDMNVNVHRIFILICCIQFRFQVAIILLSASIAAWCCNMQNSGGTFLCSIIPHNSFKLVVQNNI